VDASWHDDNQRKDRLRDDAKKANAQAGSGVNGMRGGGLRLFRVRDVRGDRDVQSEEIHWCVGLGLSEVVFDDLRLAHNLRLLLYQENPINFPIIPNNSDNLMHLISVGIFISAGLPTLSGPELPRCNP
jgi:hypothetical protein